MASSRFAGAAVADRVPLAPLTTLRVGPVARSVITCTSTEQVVAALTELRDESPLVLAGGSNVVLSDDLDDLVVVRIANAEVTVDGETVRAEAGAVWDDVVVAALEAGLGGLECLSGIPGSAGATPVQNVGAYGVEVAQVIRRVKLLDRRSGDVTWVTGDDLGFGYRTSVLKHGESAGTRCVLEVEFALDPSGRSAPLRYGELATALGAAAGDRVKASAVREAVLALRRGKGMVLDAADHDTWSVGSFFTNPVVSRETFAAIEAEVPGRRVPHYPAGDDVKLAAGWLVEAAGFGRGFPGADAPARLSTKHALALTNRGTANSADILALARRIRTGVRDAFGITLEPEPVIVGAVI
ncbi:UDP-N-acetylenolpyruvoylglucosamine reductase [Mycolicibacterium confluentis]|nr:UDP-N-acetylmuramate dehydrogenase [Mycolicibacterium confluentis]ORV21877.1 UDP-N-acetylenolpyruvoylglucosamine reductase [Mycolicibacterium confluentis]